MQKRIFLTTLALQLILLISAVYFFSAWQKEKYFRGLERQSSTELSSLVHTARQAVIDRQLQEFVGQVKRLVAENTVANVVLFDVERNTLFDLNKKHKSLHFYLEESETSQYVLVPLAGASAQEPFPYLVIEYPQHILQQLYSTLIIKSLKLFVPGLVLCVILSYILSKFLTLRFNKIITTADQIAEGKYYARTGEYGRDELARLGMAFDSILAHINNIKRHDQDYEKQLQKQINERTHQLEIANEENRAFTISVTRDLRDPLRRLKSYAQVLHEDYREQLDADGRHVIDRIQFNCRELNRLIDSLMQLSRVGHQELNRRSVNLSSMVRDVVDDISIQYPGHHVHVKLQPDLMVYADGLLLKRVVENLVENAWKFTQHNQTAMLEIGVVFNEHPVYFFRDNGIGFDADYEDRLFTPFQRLHQDKEYQGVGIGLSTVQHIVHRHGGEIWAESTPGEGATFYFTLPDEKSAPADAA